MDNPVFLLLFIGGLVALILFALNRVTKKKGGGRPIEQRVFAIDDVRVAPSGLRLWVEDGANVTPEDITAIENGLTDCFEKARTWDYDYPLRLSDYTIAILADSVRAPESGTWCYKVPTYSNYVGSEWDMGGSMYISGEVVASDKRGNIIALPNMTEIELPKDLIDRRTVTMHEAEHIILFWCNPDLAARTNTHGQGQGHPIFLKKESV